MEEKNLEKVGVDKPAHVNKMENTPINKLLIGMAWPAILSMTINSLYNIVDSMFVAQLSEDALTAVSIVTPVQMLIIALSVGSGVGINSLIARKLGAHRQAEADQAASTGLFIGALNYLVFLFIGVFVTGAFVANYAEPGTYIYEAGAQYLSIVCIGSVFIHIQVVIEKILQSTGNMIGPMACSLTGAVVNIILDPILIFGMFGLPKLGVAGAAIATVIGQLAGLCVGIVILVRGEHLVEIKLKGFKPDWHIIADIYKVGFPSIVMQSIASVMNIGYNAILVAYSTTAVAVLGVYFKIQSFVFMPVFGMNQGAMPIMGYNYGAHRKDRLMETYKFGLKMALAVMVAGLILFQTVPEFLLKLFDASDDMLAIGVPALRIISLCFPFAAYGIMTSTIFQATGHGVYSLIVSVVRQLIGILPLAFILIRIGGVTLSWVAFPLAELLGVACSTIMLVRLYNKEIKTL